MITPTRYAPATKTALALFLIGGPLIYFPVLQMFEGDFRAIPFMPLAGAMAWSLMALVPSGWLVTWIPTSAAATLVAYTLRLLATRSCYRDATKASKLILAAVISATISELCYEPGYRLAITIHPGPMPTPREAVLHTAMNRAAPDFVYRLHLGPVVMITGAILGVILAWMAIDANRRLTDSRAGLAE